MNDQERIVALEATNADLKTKLAELAEGQRTFIHVGQQLVAALAKQQPKREPTEDLLLILQKDRTRVHMVEEQLVDMRSITCETHDLVKALCTQLEEIAARLKTLGAA